MVRDLLSEIGSLRAQFERYRAAGRAPEAADWDALGDLVATLQDYETLAGAARISSTRLTAVIESLPFDIWLIDGDGRYALQNSTCREHWGDVIGRRPAEIAPDAEIAARWADNNRRAFAGEQVRGEVVYRHDSEVRTYYNILSPISDGGYVIAIIGVNLDITHEKRLAEEVERRNKLESLGLLAGGIAHDFNNLMMGIRSMVALAARHLEPAGPPGKLLAQAERGCVNAETLARRLLTFARGGEPVCAPTAVGPVAKEAIQLAMSGSATSCDFDLPDDLWWANIDAGQIGQVFSNLALNAVQALPNGGAVRVFARNLPAGTAEALDLNDRDYVQISMVDDGPGIPAEHLPHLFDPYFTTHEAGHGLGLAIVHSVIDKHHGSVRVDSRRGNGTRVDIFLPATAARGGATEPEPEPEPFSGRILVVDDDPLVCNAISGMLEVMGFEVTAAADCEQAVAAYSAGLARNQRFRAVIIDLTLRGVGGDACFAQLRALDPATRAIVTSGYATNPIVAHYRRYGWAAALPKPFSFDQLSDAMTQALAPASTSPQAL